MEGRNILTGIGAAIMAAIGITSMAERNEAGEITTAGTVDAFEVQVGDCLDAETFTSSEISEVPGVPCTEPHDYQVYAAFDISEVKWPGDERVDELATAGCYDRFAGAIGRSYDESAIDFTTIYPTEGSWKQRDDREVLCVAYHMEGELLTASVIGSGL